MNKNAFRSNPAAPIVIGGVGGSGTRLVAKIFQQARFFLGSDLNIENDNLWFTLLFRRPQWFRRVAGKDDDRIITGLQLLTKAMLGAGKASSSELSFLRSAVVDTTLNFRESNKATRGLWAYKRANKMLRATKKPLLESYRGWGWKEPNSHIYLPYLSREFSALKYIHVIRHGLDLAFSRNQVQLYNWSFLFDLTLPGSRSDVPAASLRYWVRANQRAADFGKTIGPERFLTVNFDQLCRSPENEVERMLNFVEAEIPAQEFAGLRALPQKPPSTGRYLQNDCRVFDATDIEAVRRFGFEVRL